MTRPLLVPVDGANQPPTSRPGRPNLPSPIQAQLHTDSVEDDERDAERLANGNGPITNGLKTPFGSAENLGSGGHAASVPVEPTITEESQLPTFVLESSKAQSAPGSVSGTMVAEMGTLAGSVSRSNGNLISPTKASTFELTMASSTMGPDFGHPDPVMKGPVFNNGKKNIGIGTSTSLGSLTTPALLRPGNLPLIVELGVITQVQGGLGRPSGF